jgi:hypothetical protein
MMTTRTQKIILGLTAMALIVSVLAPRPVEARNPFRSIFRALRRTVTFVVNLPDKATRWMGPVLGPIASSILTQNLSNHHKLGQIFRNASKADKIFQSIDEQKRLLADVRTIYQNQATDLDTQIAKLEQVRANFASQLINDPDYGFANYKNDVIALDRVIDSYRDAAANLRATAQNLNTGDLLGMLGRDAIKNFLRGSESIAIGEIQNELRRFIDPNVIKTFVELGNGDVLDVLLDGDIDAILNQDRSGIDRDALLERIKDRIKNMAQSQREDLRRNWNARIRELINAQITEMKNDLPQANANKPAESAPDDLGPIPVDEHGCQPGYTWSPQSGISCIQENCNNEAIPNAHWSYEGYCVCGSSGSIAENPSDPNKECAYPSTYRSCPGCVYECVKLDEECPLEGIVP